MSEADGGPGEILRGAREGMEISCREVAEALNLPLHIVEAIEANDYERLPAAVFTRGYIRAYARLLELDSDQIVARYPEAEEEAPSPAAASANPLQDLIREHPRWLLGGVGAILLIVAIALVQWLWPAPVESPRAVAPQPSVAAESPASVDSQLEGRSAPQLEPELELSSAPQPEAQPAQPATGNEAVAAAPAAGPEIAVAESSTASAADSATSASADTPPGVRRISPVGDDRLSFRFSEDCWVAIKSASGESLYSDLSRAGRTLDLVGEAPFRVLLGYAPGVEMSFNGETVALAPHTRNNVATLVLGQ